MVKPVFVLLQKAWSIPGTLEIVALLWRYGILLRPKFGERSFWLISAIVLCIRLGDDMAKIRTGFVSNSSSSSFVCCKCGEETYDYDWEPRFDSQLCVECWKENPQFQLTDYVDEITAAIGCGNTSNDALYTKLHILREIGRAHV